MQRKWVANIDRSKAILSRDDLESESGNVCLIGRPLADGPYSVTELEVMNLVGIYMEVPFTAKKSDSHCLECKGGVQLNDTRSPGHQEEHWE